VGIKTGKAKRGERGMRIEKKSVRVFGVKGHPGQARYCKRTQQFKYFANFPFHLFSNHQFVLRSNVRFLCKNVFIFELKTFLKLSKDTIFLSLS